MENPETYTGYLGAPIWEAIYEENCLLDRIFGNLPTLFKNDKPYEKLIDLVLD